MVVVCCFVKKGDASEVRVCWMSLEGICCCWLCVWISCLPELGKQVIYNTGIAIQVNLAVLWTFSITVCMRMSELF
jgi:hypothetical protein